MKTQRLCISLSVLLVIALSPISFTNGNNITQSNAVKPSITPDDKDNIRVVDMAVVGDYRFYEIYGNKTADVMIQAINDTNRYLRASDIPLAMRVTEVMIFTSASDANSSFVYEETNPGEINATKLLQSLDEFSDNNSTLSSFEDVELFTGFDLTDNIFGIAYRGSNQGGPLITREDAHKGTSVVQGTIQNSEIIGIIAAHELGHSFSAKHDGIDNDCPEEGFIMTVKLQNPIPDSYSTCSVSIMTTHLQEWFNDFIDQDQPSISFLNTSKMYNAEDRPIHLEFSATDNHLRKYDVIIDGKFYTGGRLQGTDAEFGFDYVPSSGGEHNITVVVEDYANKEAIYSDIFYIEDTKPPSISSPVDITINNMDNGNIEWTVYDLELGKAELYVNNSQDQTYDLKGDNATITVNLTSQNPGVYNYTLVVYDIVNNTISDTVFVTILSENGSSDKTSQTPDIIPSIISDLNISYYLIFLTTLLMLPLLRKETRTNW